LDAFLSGPKGRSKSVIPNLLVVVGWKEACTREATNSGPMETNHVTHIASQRLGRFDVAFVEELWRRNFERFYRLSPPTIVNDLLEKLLYGPTASAEEVRNSATDTGPDCKVCELKNNSRKVEKQFAEYAAFRLDHMKKSKVATARSTFGKNGERPPEDDTREYNIEYKSRQLAEYDAHANWMDDLVKNELSKINGMNQYLAPFFGEHILGETREHGDFGPELRRTILIQALTYRQKAAMKGGVNSGDYKNTFDFITQEGGKSRVSLSLMEHVHATFERKRKEHWEASLIHKGDLQTAESLVCCRDPMALAGRLLANCPTRGGNIFQNFVSLLCVSSTNASGKVKANPIPLLEQKVRVILTGKLAVVEGGHEDAVISRGESWTTCPPDTVARLRCAVGDEIFTSIELSMRGTWGWVYRESDIPNRHGHCNSNPNPDLGGSFSGFSR